MKSFSINSPFKTAQHSRKVSQLNEFDDISTQCSSIKRDTIVKHINKTLNRKDQLQPLNGDYQKSFQEILEEEMNEEFVAKEPTAKIKTQRKIFKAKKVVLPDESVV